MTTRYDPETARRQRELEKQMLKGSRGPLGKIGHAGRSAFNLFSRIKQTRKGK